jgi:hypothetical protein
MSPAAQPNTRRVNCKMSPAAQTNSELAFMIVFINPLLALIP